MKAESGLPTEFITNDRKFFERLTADIPITLAYYPGCGTDDGLERYLPNATIVNLDHGKGQHKLERLRTDVKVRGKIERPPFPSNTFDLAYVKDAHLSRGELNGIVEVIKPNGLLIYSHHNCQNVGISTDRKLPELPKHDNDFWTTLDHEELKITELDYFNEMITVFSKGREKYNI